MSTTDNNRYFWIKLNKDFFQKHEMRILEAMPNGKEYELFYLKLLCEATSHDGELRMNSLIPYDENMLSGLTNTNVDIVRSACSVLKGMGLLECWDDGTLFLNAVKEMTGSETGYAVRKRAYRGQLGDNVPKSIEYRDKSIDINKKDNKKEFTTPSLEEVQSFIKENNYHVKAETFYNFYESNGWKVGKNKMKDWKAAVRSWNSKIKVAAVPEWFYEPKKESSEKETSEDEELIDIARIFKR